MSLMVSGWSGPKNSSLAAKHFCSSSSATPGRKTICNAPNRFSWGLFSFLLKEAMGFIALRWVPNMLNRFVLWWVWLWIFSPDIWWYLYNPSKGCKRLGFLACNTPFRIYNTSRFKEQPHSCCMLRDAQYWVISNENTLALNHSQTLTWADKHTLSKWKPTSWKKMCHCWFSSRKSIHPKGRPN